MPIRQLYHIFYDLETQFRNLDEAKKWMKGLDYLEPSIPRTTMSGEDRVTPRVCAGNSVTDCVNAIKLWGVFRRCLSADSVTEDTFKNYENWDEIYPIIIVTVEGNFFHPSEDRVPDVKITNEYWSLESVKVKSRNLYWIDNKAVVVHEELNGEYKCVALNTKDKISAGKHHPWIDGKGHPLISSEMGYEQWPLSAQKSAMTQIYYDKSLGRGELVFIIPELPLSGYCQCISIATGEAYRSRLDRCKKFTGFFDKNWEPLFDDDWVHYSGSRTTNYKGYTIVQNIDGGFCLISDGTKEIISFSKLEWNNFRIIDIKSNEHRGFKEIYSQVWKMFRLGFAGNIDSLPINKMNF